MIRIWLLCVGCLFASPVSATIYYISPSGSDSNNGLSTSAPFLTFAYAVNASRAWCGHTLTLMDGTYGDGTSTGRLLVSGVACTAGNELTIRAQNQRKAQISTNGTGSSCRVQSTSAYIIFDGLYCRSIDNNGTTTAGDGEPVTIRNSTHITVRNSLVQNPNRYTNTHAIGVYFSQDLLIEDNEVYVFHRHCLQAWQSQRVVGRRLYCNPRGGAIPGGVGASFGTNRADAVISMYPCTDCILENSIGDATTSALYLTEMNSTYGGGVLMSGSQVLGSILYNSNYANGIYPNARTSADLNHTPQNITIRDVAFVDYNSVSAMIRCSDCVGVTIDHITGLGVIGGSAGQGILIDDTSVGATAGQESITITNSLMANVTGYTFRVSVVGSTWSGDELIANAAGTATFSPSLPSNWTNTSTSAHGMGTCKVWVPTGALGKGAGTGGSDIGATILYRYVDGVLTTTPLWDPITGEFPHGALVAGVNDVAGQSLFDFHQRINVNTNGCSFPSGYGGTNPVNPGSYVTSTDLTGAHVRTVDIGSESLTVGVMVRHDGLNVADPIAVTSSCGNESIPLLLAALHSPANDRSQAIFGKINPTPGTCTLTPTFNDPSRVSGWVMISGVENNVASYNSPVGGSDTSASPAITVPTSSAEKIIDFIATSNAPTISSGPDQIFTAQQSHATVALRGASSLQSGAAGGAMTWVLGSSVGWVQQGVSLIPSGGPSSNATFTLTHYRIDGLLGSASTPEVTLGMLAAQDTQGKIGTTGAGRIRAEILIGTQTSSITGLALYCRKNGGSYAQITNAFGSNSIRLYGPGVQSTIPTHGTPTTQRFSGTFQAGITVRDASAIAQLSAIPSGTRTEVDFQIVLGNGAVAGDVFDCQIRKSGGTAFDAYTVTPSILAVGPSASMGF